MNRLVVCLLCIVSLQCSSKCFGQLNIQLIAEDAYPTFIIPLFGIEGGISGLTPLADKLERPYVYIASNEEVLRI